MQKGIFEKECANNLQPVLKLQNMLADGERSAEKGGWLFAADVRKKYEVWVFAFFSRKRFFCHFIDI